MLPPNSECPVEGKVVHTSKRQAQLSVPALGVVENIKSLPRRHGVLMARSVVSSKDGKVPVRFINLNAEPVIINGGCTVALLQQAAGVTDVEEIERESSSMDASGGLPEHIQPLGENVRRNSVLWSLTNFLVF